MSRTTESATHAEFNALETIDTIEARIYRARGVVHLLGTSSSVRDSELHTNIVRSLDAVADVLAGHLDEIETLTGSLRQAVRS